MPRGTIVTDSVTSSGLAQFIADHGAVTTASSGATRTSSTRPSAWWPRRDLPHGHGDLGHCALAETTSSTTGAYMVTKLIIFAAQLRAKGRSLEDLLAGLKEPLDAVEIRLNLPLDQFREFGQEAIHHRAGLCQDRSGMEPGPGQPRGYPGQPRPQHGDGWFLLRMSVHDPVMPLNIESDQAGGPVIARQLMQLIAAHCRGGTPAPWGAISTALSANNRARAACESTHTRRKHRMKPVGEYLCQRHPNPLRRGGVQKANSGHPGLPMGAAAAAFALWGREMKHNPADPDFVDRDRFVSRRAMARCCSTRCCTCSATG